MQVLLFKYCIQKYITRYTNSLKFKGKIKKNE